REVFQRLQAWHGPDTRRPSGLSEQAQPSPRLTATLARRCLDRHDPTSVRWRANGRNPRIPHRPKALRIARPYGDPLRKDLQIEIAAPSPAEMRRCAFAQMRPKPAATARWTRRWHHTRQ